jgi:hypothetical protein
MRDLEAADKTFSPKKELVQSKFNNALLLFSVSARSARPYLKVTGCNHHVKAVWLVGA